MDSGGIPRSCLTDSKQLTDNGITPTYVAAHKGNAECVELLLKHNANQNQAPGLVENM